MERRISSQGNGPRGERDDGERGYYYGGGAGSRGGAELAMDAPEDILPASTNGQPPIIIGGAGDVTVGISIEPAASIAQQLASLPQPTTASSSQPMPRNDDPSQQGGGALVQQQPSQKTIVQRIMENAFNFLASYEAGNGEIRVPLRALREFAGKIERRAEMGGFGD